LRIAPDRFFISIPRPQWDDTGENAHEAVKKKSGGYSTAADILEGCAISTLLSDISWNSGSEQTESTYVDAFGDARLSEDRPHPTPVSIRPGQARAGFPPATPTCRISPSAMKWQAHPRGFYRPAGSMLMGVDYSQIDLRALAHLSRTRIAECFPQ